MRKFKIMPKLAAGMLAVAMTLGSLSGLGANTPVTVYAATPTATSIRITDAPQVIAPKGTGSFSGIVYDENGDEMENATITWSVAGGVAETKFNSSTLTIAEKETAKELTVTATVGTITASVKVIVGTGAYLDVSYEDMSASIKSNGEDSFFFLEVLKDENGTKPGTVYCYEDFEAGRIDLSFLKLSKEVYVRVYGDKNQTPLKIYELAAQPKKPSVKYVAGQDTFYKTFQLNKEDLTDKTVQTLQWKTQYGTEWMDFEMLEEAMASLTVAGSTILVRKISTDWDAPATTEVKVKIAAVPKAPKVTLDYAKNVIKLPKTSEIRVLGWVIPAEKKVEGATTLDVSAPFYYKVGTNKDDLTVAPAVLAEKLVDKYLAEYNAARGKLTDTTLKNTYPVKTTEDEKNDDGTIKTESDRTKMLKEFAEKGYSFFIRTEKGKKAASQPTFVNVKAAPVIAVREKEDPNSTTTPKAKIKEDVIAVMGVDEKGDAAATANTLTFTYSDTELKLTPAGSYVYSYSLDGIKFTKLSKETSIKLEKIDVAKGVVIRTEGTKEDTKNKVEGNWASNELKLPVPAAKVEVSGKTECTAGGTAETYKAVVKDALGQEIKNPTIKWSATGATISETSGALALPSTAGKVTITATYKDAERGVEVKGTIEVEVKAAQ